MSKVLIFANRKYSNLNSLRNNINAIILGIIKKPTAASAINQITGIIKLTAITGGRKKNHLKYFSRFSPNI